MDPSQQELRQSAAEIFMESLDQLGQSLQTSRDASCLNAAGDRPVKLPQASGGDRIDVEALEDAAADIEQFMQIDPSQTDQANLD